MPETNRIELYALVYEVVNEIPEGRVATYGQIAALIGLPRHARHVGFALRRLDKDTSIPWHRVVNAQGKLHISNKRHPEYQREKLAQEGIQFNDNGNISLKHYQWQPQ